MWCWASGLAAERRAPGRGRGVLAVFVEFVIERIDERGWVVRTPFRYAIHTLDLRPTQVQISFNQRVLNAMLIQFDPEGLETFLEWHGRTAGDSTSNMHEILKCYAFAPNGGVDCPFLTVVSRLDPSQRFDPEKKEIIRK